MYFPFNNSLIVFHFLALLVFTLYLRAYAGIVKREGDNLFSLRLAIIHFESSVSFFTVLGILRRIQMGLREGWLWMNVAVTI